MKRVRMMKTKKLSKLQKLMVVFIPLIVLLLIASIVMCAAFSFLPMPASNIVSTGNLTIAFAGASAMLAILGLVFALFGEDADEE